MQTEYRKKVKRFGKGGAHITLPKKEIGKKAKVQILGNGEKECKQKTQES